MCETKTQREMWRLKAPREVVEALDDIKYEFRISRVKIVERILRVGIKLWEREPDGERTNFERLEEQLFGADDCLELDQGGC